MASRRISLFIAVFLALQLALPTSYYACREDEYDERFAWRMFSPERMVECDPRFWLHQGGRGRQRVDLNRAFHQAWIRTAQRGRVEVVRRMALELCALNPGSEVRVELICDPIDGEPYQRSADDDVCVTGEIW